MLALITMQDMPPIDLQHHILEVSVEPQIKIHAIEAGPQNSTRTIVFIHGYGGWAEQWLHQFRCFGQSSRVIALDLRGHSKSDKPHSQYTNDEFLRDFESSFDQLNVEKPFTIVGHSYGAALASEYAAAHPENIEKIILLNAAVNYAVPFYLEIPFWVPNIIFDAVLSLINKIRLAYAAPSYVLKSLYWNSLSKWQGKNVLMRIDKPTLVLAPKSDPILNKLKMEAVWESTPNSQVEIIPTRTHMTMTKQPGVVNSAIAKFLELEDCG